MQIPKWIKDEDPDKKLRKLALEAIEKANEKVKMSISLCAWMRIHQGNDYY